MTQKVLIVDDHIDFIQSIQLVAEMGGYQVVAVSSAKEALEMLDESFDILVTDLMMPEIDGFALVNKALEINPKLKTLLISAALELAKERFTESAGFDLVENSARFLAKPFDAETFLARLQALWIIYFLAATLCAAF